MSAAPNCAYEIIHTKFTENPRINNDCFYLCCIFVSYINNMYLFAGLEWASDNCMINFMFLIYYLNCGFSISMIHLMIQIFQYLLETCWRSSKRSRK